MPYSKENILLIVAIQTKENIILFKNQIKQIVGLSLLGTFQEEKPFIKVLAKKSGHALTIVHVAARG